MSSCHGYNGGKDYEREDHREKIGKTVKEAGGIASKLICPELSGLPDRIVLLPGGGMVLVEVKVPGKVPRPLQEARHRMLRHLGFLIYVLDDKQQNRGCLMKYEPDNYQAYTTGFIV